MVSAEPLKVPKSREEALCSTKMHTGAGQASVFPKPAVPGRTGTRRDSVVTGVTGYATADGARSQTLLLTLSI